MKAVTDNAQTSKPGPTSFTDGSRECRNANAFIQEIRKEQGSGFGFIPFVGAGFSAASGIPLISQMNEYLRRCIFLALGINPGTSKDVREPWNPRTDSWPPLIDPLHRQKGYYQQEIYRALKNLKDQDSQDSAIYQEAFGAMAEWRTALSFLSRLIREDSSVHVDTRRSLKLSLGTPKQEVIDACFRHVTRDKSPSVTHTMLAVLSSYLRIDLMLTTNFDDLLERAFWANQDNLQVFEVHLGDRLPQWSNIDRERTLVKLHGSRHSLRADYTLDDSPPLDDLRCFLEYLLRRRVSERQTSNGSAVARHEVRNHLLVTGMSPREKRTKEFIRYAAAHTTNLIVFWVCYSAEDLKKVKEFALECWGPGQRDNTGCFVLHHTDPGMLLFHLAQSARNTLPPYGTVFPSVTRIPFPPLPARNLFNNSADSDDVRAKKLANSSKFRAKMEKNIQQCIGEVNKRRTRRLVVATGPRLVHGITSACAEVFKHFAQWNRCLWIDMNDIDSADNLFEVVIETAYLSLGLEHWTPVYMERDGRPRSVEMKLLTEFTDQEWIIFLNAREEPGSNRTSKENYPSNCSNGWIDRRLQRRGSSKWEDTSDSLQQFKMS